MTMLLVIGNKRYSSWSLRAALALELTEEPYGEMLVGLRRADTRAQILAHSPTGKVPLLVTEQGPIWDSLAIAEYLAETYAGGHACRCFRRYSARHRALDAVPYAFRC